LIKRSDKLTKELTFLMDQLNVLQLSNARIKFSFLENYDIHYQQRVIILE